MIITGRRVRNLMLHLGGIPEGQRIVLGVVDVQRFERFRQLGFGANPVAGDTVLPARFGPVSKFNAEGRYIIHRDLPKETAYRQLEWHRTEWHGPDPVEVTGIVDIPYQRYPRTFEAPPSVEMTISDMGDGRLLLVTEETRYIPENHKLILHTLNLFLEIFGECTVMDAGFDQVRIPKMRRLNWTILPKGQVPWERLREELRPIIERQPPARQPIIWHRLQSVEAYKPPFMAVGNGGFSGYVILGFPERHLYILECAHTGNATYVFGDDWEALSQLTKAEVLSEGRQKDRLIHRNGWDQRLAGLFV